MDIRANMEAEIARIIGDINEQRAQLRSRIQRYTENEELDFINATKSAEARVYQLRMDLRDLIAREAIELAANHPLAGKQVSRSRWAGGVKHIERGIVEVVTGQTVQPKPKTGWPRLPIGTVGVRLLGPNGTPRKTLVKLVLREDALKSDQMTNMVKDVGSTEAARERWLGQFWVVTN